MISGHDLFIVFISAQVSEEFGFLSKVLLSATSVMTLSLANKDDFLTGS